MAGAVTMPHNWTPRSYQRPMWGAMESGVLRSFLLWHRRSGKDDNSLHYAATAAIQRPATYWYMLPQQNQVRRAIWEAVNPHSGRRRIEEAFPPAICRRKRSNDMVIELVNGSMVHFLGSDSFDALVGSPPLGLVFSEYSLTNPSAWAFLRPILDENGGWAIFNMTPRGRNHGHAMYEYAIERGWFVQVCTPDDTGVFTAQQLADAERELKALYGPDDGEALYRQEYWCSFDAALVGAYYGKLLQAAELEKRICRVLVEPALPVNTAWDLGMDDSTAIWFYQLAGREIRLVDYLEGSGHGLDYYANELGKRSYTYGEHLLPHDVQVRELGTGKSRLEVLRSLGLGRIRVIPAQSVADGINAVRVILPRCFIDREKCKDGLNALAMYRKEYDEERKIYKDKPFHDWTSHAADAIRQLALGLKERVSNSKRPTTARRDYDMCG